MFVFGALIEYAFVSYQDNNRQSEKQKELAQAKQRKKRQKMEMVDAEIYQPPCTCHLVSVVRYKGRLGDGVNGQLDQLGRLFPRAGLRLAHLG